MVSQAESGPPQPRHISGASSACNANNDDVAGTSGGHEELCFIEPSVNSIRISFRLGNKDALEGALVGMYMRVLMQRADEVGILRRVALAGYDVTFLVTARHVAELSRPALVDIIAGFLEASDSQINALKLSVCSQGRQAATEYLGALAF